MIFRALVLAFVASILIGMWFEPKPQKVSAVQVDYCVVDYHVGYYDQNHEFHTGWGKGYGPCSLLDRYENI